MDQPKVQNIQKKEQPAEPLLVFLIQENPMKESKNKNV